MLHSDNPELLIYTGGKLHITVLGGIRLTGLERLKVTLKLTLTGRPNGMAFRHHLDLYNSMQTEQLTEKSAEALELLPSEVSAVIGELTTALENYQAGRLEEMKPKKPEQRTFTEADRKAAITFLKAPNLLERTRQAIAIGEEDNSLIAYLTYSSRKRHTPLHLMCLGASGTGKTWLQEKVIRADA